MTDDGPKVIVMAIDRVTDRPSTQEVVLSLSVPQERAALISQFFGKHGEHVAVSFAAIGGAKMSRRYSAEAQKLWKSRFFDAPEVLRAIGTDDDYRGYCQLQVCRICGTQDFVEQTGELMCEAAHVRRAGPSGTAFKGAYRTISLCVRCHRIQHNDGERASLEANNVSFNTENDDRVQAAKDWFDIELIKQLKQWSWWALKQQLGYHHWFDVPPKDLLAWAYNNNVVEFLPESFR